MRAAGRACPFCEWEKSRQLGGSKGSEEVNLCIPSIFPPVNPPLLRKAPHRRRLRQPGDGEHDDVFRLYTEILAVEDRAVDSSLVELLGI